MGRTTTALSVKKRRKIAEWPAREAALLDQIASWSAKQGWVVDRGREREKDWFYGSHEGAVMVIHVPDEVVRNGRVPDGEVAVIPFPPGPNSWEDGQVRITAHPSHSNVRLRHDGNGSWEVIVGTNIPLRRPWTRKTFVQLIGDMLR